MLKRQKDERIRIQKDQQNTDSEVRFKTENINAITNFEKLSDKAFA